MRIAEMSWMQVEAYLTGDDRAVLPIGSTEQHAYLSLATDSILAERVAVEAAAPLGVPVFPVLAYGITPGFLAYPGTVSLRAETHRAIVTDVLDSLRATGFRRVLVVNGHGGNAPAREVAAEWASAHPGMTVRFHSWWNAPRTIALVERIDPVATHASWMENFPWTRLAVLAPPGAEKPALDLARIRRLAPRELREYLGDGSFGGRHARDDAEMRAIWAEAVEETRAQLADPWA
jgi:creatinine amidohydrolase